MEAAIATPVRNVCSKTDPPSVQPTPPPPQVPSSASTGSETSKPPSAMTTPETGSGDAGDGKTPGKTNRQAGRLCQKYVPCFLVICSFKSSVCFNMIVILLLVQHVAVQCQIFVGYLH